MFYGYAGDDILDGGSGTDQLIGGAGDDTYILHAGDGGAWDAPEHISENLGEGIDTPIDQNRCAHSRRPMDMMRPGWSMRRFQWWQQ
ncbi:hypothetical protein ACQW02_09540 [Humitalea sp. 24SJ18S-53]|uniref:hypothetical protein n=1 Tax=Humitalea sp. 24SJ18S-53 TaxID=3422307 RepID=UPI003D67A32F